MNTRGILESMVRAEVKFYNGKERLIHAHRMAHCKINTQEQLLHQKIKQWEILEKDKFNEECKKYFITYYINNK